MHDFHASYSAEGWQAILLNAALGLIVIGCFVIAFQFYLARRPHNGHTLAIEGQYLRSRARRAFLQLLLIFLFSGVSGYLPRLIAFPMPLFVATHVLLAAATWWYILSRQAVVIAEAMSSRDRP